MPIASLLHCSLSPLFRCFKIAQKTRPRGLFEKKTPGLFVAGKTG